MYSEVFAVVMDARAREQGEKNVRARVKFSTDDF